ncbi:helix-turn-helix domain-containing protein [Hallella bergensis]|uniref:helix-turn-helix domain-containing protein n=1 Tax=Hallella bergensis TaxID=242750 RepID=UPI003990BCB7
MEQNKEVREAWDFVEHTGTSIFLTGKAGTGKTTFLKTVKEHSSKRMIVVAPTGVAAINAGGVTIHSFFQLPLSPYVPGTSIKDRFDFGKEKRRIIRTLDMVVIDEISMVRSDLLDAIDFVLRRYRDHTQPFGGVQLLMIGDLQQLTPVVTPQDEEILRTHYDTPYFFGSKALQKISYVTIQLTHVYRQQDQDFIHILNHIRDGKPQPQDIACLNNRYKPAFVPKAEDGYIRLTTHNRLADNYNETELEKLSGERYVYKAVIKDNFPEYSYPADVKLELKLGAQVVFIKNDASGTHRYYNGRIGRVVNLDSTTIKVLCAGDREPIEVEPQEWENTKYVINDQTKVIEPQVQGVFRQYPLRLAWAITIHKSQGLTFEHAIIDAGLSFASGQVYVALSRCKSLEGLVLASPITDENIINDHRVAEYISHQQEAAEQSVRNLPNLKEAYFRHQLLDLFDFSALMGAERMVHRTLLEYFRGVQSLTNLHGQAVVNLKKEVMDVAYKWQGVIRATSSEGLHDEGFLERVRRSAGYFLDAIERNLKKVLQLTKEAKTQNTKGAELMEERYGELLQNYLAKNKLLRRMEEKVFDVPTYMLAKHESMLDAMEVVNPGRGGARPRRRRKAGQSPFSETEAVGSEKQVPRERKAQRVSTYDTSYQMFMNGLKPEDIARERGLTVGTIYGHLARFVSTGKLSADKVIDISKVKAIRHAISQLPEGASLSEVKAICRADITWNEIRLMMHDKG